MGKHALNSEHLLKVSLPADEMHSKISFERFICDSSSLLVYYTFYMRQLLVVVLVVHFEYSLREIHRITNVELGCKNSNWGGIFLLPEYGASFLPVVDHHSGIYVLIFARRMNYWGIWFRKLQQFEYWARCSWWFTAKHQYEFVASKWSIIYQSNAKVQ